LFDGDPLDDDLHAKKGSGSEDYFKPPGCQENLGGVHIADDDLGERQARTREQGQGRLPCLDLASDCSLDLLEDERLEMFRVRNPGPEDDQ
jgi:hypothetical protein